MASFQCLKGVSSEEEDRFFSRVYCDGTRGNVIKLKVGRFKLDIRKKLFLFCFFFYNEGSEALAQVTQRGGECLIPGDTQSQAGQGSEHLMEL